MKIKLCQKKEIIEGTGKKFTVQGRTIAVFKEKGKYYAIENSCPHKGEDLCDGVVTNYLVACPAHGWEFDIRDGKNPTIPVHVRSYAIHVEEDFLFIEIE